MKIALQFAMPSELHALPGARELAPLETVSGVPIFEIAPDILACAGGVSKGEKVPRIHSARCPFTANQSPVDTRPVTAG